MGRRSAVCATVAAASVLMGAACSTAVQGTPVSVFHDPFNVAGLPATDGPSGLRPGAAGPDREIEGSDGGRIDELAGGAISDIEEYWAPAYPDTYGDEFSTAEALISWDANGFD